MRELTMSDILRKTAAGRGEQQQRSQTLGARQRHVLILCDGRRALGELCALMGTASLQLAQELLAAGLVEVIDPVSGVGTSTAPLAPSAVPAAQLARAVAPPPRRSVALSRMYMFDMVERVLGAQSGPARARLRAADQPEDLLPAFEDCLGLIAELAGQAQADKVRGQLCAMLPEEWVDDFERGEQGLQVTN